MKTINFNGNDTYDDDDISFQQKNYSNMGNSFMQYPLLQQ